jgi:hypothetical protein
VRGRRPTPDQIQEAFHAVRSACSTVARGARASEAAAGRIFGDIKIDGKPVPAGVLVTLQPIVNRRQGKPETTARSTRPKPTRSVPTSSWSRTRASASSPSCSRSNPPSLEVFSNKEATRYDLILAKKDDKLELRRK